MIRPILIASLPLLALGCAPVETDEEFVSDGPPVRVVGEPVSCISIVQIRQSKVRDDRTIDFEMTGNKVYRNTLTSNCPGLGMDRAITYETSIDQLCSPQIIYVLQNIGGRPQRGAGCSLGKFVPVEYVRDDKNDD